jgi:hypothetical protein
MRPNHCAENQGEAMQQTLQQPTGPLSICLQANCAGCLLPPLLVGSHYQLQPLVPDSLQLDQGLQDLQDFPRKQNQLEIE